MYYQNALCYQNSFLDILLTIIDLTNSTQTMSVIWIFKQIHIDVTFPS